MASRLTVRVIGTEVSGQERIYSSIAREPFDLDELESLIQGALAEATHAVGGSSEVALQALAPEVSILLTGDDVRPALHLSAQLIARLALAGASVDFDPYV